MIMSHYFFLFDSFLRLGQKYKNIFVVFFCSNDNFHICFRDQLTFRYESTDSIIKTQQHRDGSIYAHIWTRRQKLAATQTQSKRVWARKLCDFSQIVAQPSMLCPGALQSGLGEDKKAKNWFISTKKRTSNQVDFLHNCVELKRKTLLLKASIHKNTEK